MTLWHSLVWQLASSKTDICFSFEKFAYSEHIWHFAQNVIFCFPHKMSFSTFLPQFAFSERRQDFVSKCPTQVPLFHLRLSHHPNNIDFPHHKCLKMCGCKADELLQHKQFDSILLLFNFLWKIRQLEHFWQKCQFVHTRFIPTSKNLLNCFSHVFDILHILSSHLQNAPQVGRKPILPNSATRKWSTFIPPQYDLWTNRTKTWPHNTCDVCGIANWHKSVDGELLWSKNCSKCPICCSKKVHFHPWTPNLTPYSITYHCHIMHIQCTNCGANGIATKC